MDTLTRSGTGKGGEHESAIVPIDPTRPISPATVTFDDPPPGVVSPWKVQLEALVELVESGQAEVGSYYLIGSFASLHGARNRLKIYVDNRAKFVPALKGHKIMFQSRRFKDEGRSELYAAVMTDQNAVARHPGFGLENLGSGIPSHRNVDVLA